MKAALNFLNFTLIFVLLITLAACDLDDNKNMPPFDYSKYVGVWQGYAIAIIETLVIKDILEDRAAFFFVCMFPLTSKSPVHIMPIIDSQIQFTGEILALPGTQRAEETKVLTFYGDHIIFLRSVRGFDNKDIVTVEFDFEWTLRRVCCCHPMQ